MPLATIHHPLPRDVQESEIVDFSTKRKIRELALFGSVVRDDWQPESDVDVLVSFEPDAPWSLFDLTAMQDELQAIFGAKVDLVEEVGIRNPFRRHSILRDKQVIYAC